VAHHELQLREEPADLVDAVDRLAGHRDAGTGDADTAADRQVELHALGINRIEALVIDRHLRKTSTLNMYSAGKSNDSRLSRSRNSGRMKP
jgi:hypothetical protein